jgi:hypothetical protein
MSGQQWCAFIAGGIPCAFGSGHRIGYHYVDGRRYDRVGRPLSAAEFARITAGGTR